MRRSSHDVQGVGTEDQLKSEFRARPDDCPVLSLFKLEIEFVTESEGEIGLGTGVLTTTEGSTGVVLENFDVGDTCIEEPVLEGVFEHSMRGRHS